MQEGEFDRARASKLTPLLNMTTPIPVRRPTKQEESMTVEFPPPLLSEAEFSSSSSSSTSTSSRFRVWERAKRTEVLPLLCPTLQVDVEEETNSKVVVLNRSKEEEEGERSDCEGLEWKES